MYHMNLLNKENSPLSPLVPLEHAHKFSPNMLSRRLEQIGTTQRCLRTEFLNSCLASPIHMIGAPPNSPAILVLTPNRINAKATTKTKSYVNYINKQTNNAVPTINIMSADKDVIVTKRICKGLNLILNQIGLGYLSNLFRQEEIDYEIFLTMTEDELQSIGVGRKDRAVILRTIRNMTY